MTSNRLNLLELRQTNEVGRQKIIQVEGRLQAVIEKLILLRDEVEDPHTYRIDLHMGENRGLVSVKPEFLKKGY